jgi:hypothetical protein
LIFNTGFKHVCSEKKGSIKKLMLTLMESDQEVQFGSDFKLSVNKGKVIRKLALYSNCFKV